MAAPESQNSSSPPGALEPLRDRTFLTIWLANLVSNIGGWMQSVAVSWEMTHLAPSPLFVALVATASVLPVFFFAYPAGVLADQFDRRKYLIACQLWMMLAAALLAVLAFTGDLTAWSLLILTFALGIGNAVNGPAWQSAVPELVGRRLLPPAVALNSAGFNVARTVGPGIGGIIYALAGPVTLFALNAVSFLAVVVALLRWKRVPTQQAPRGFLAGVMSGVVYLRQAPDIHIILLRSILFFLPAAALGALLPLLARDHLLLDATGLGILMSAFGGGAVLGAFVLPGLRRRFSDEGAVLAAMLIYAVGLGLVMLPQPLISGLGVGLAGIGWICVISSNNVAAQLRLPAWVRARGIAVYQMSFFGSLAVGSVIWGKVAEFIGPVWTIGAALALLLLFTVLVTRLRRLAEPPSEG